MKIKLSEKLSLASLSLFILSFWLFLCMEIMSVFHVTQNDTFTNTIEFASFLIMIPTLAFSIRYAMVKNQKAIQHNKSEAEKLKLRMDAIDDTNAIVEFTPDGNIISINKKFNITFGYCNDVIGKHHSVLVPDTIKNTWQYKQFWLDLRDGKAHYGQFHRVNSDGEDVHIIATYVPIRNKKNEVYKIFKIAQDNTDKFKTLAKLHTKNIYLEHAAKILRHDMHSGINTYIPRGIKSLLRRLGDDKIKELNIEMPIRLISEGLAHTQKVYQGVFEFTNLVKDNATIKTQQYNLKEMLQCYLKRTSYYDKVKIEWLPTTNVNESLFCTAIDNLIRNGLRYNDSDTKWVKISGDTLKDSNGKWCKYIIIEDNGRGMTQAEFDEFSKPYVRREGQEESGSGLGLNICSLILKEHGFTISCEKTKLGTKLLVKI